jgi:hypothetical protein
VRKSVKRVLGIGIVAGAAYAVWRAIEAQRQPTGLTWEPRPFPYPPEPRVVPTSEPLDEALDPWVDAADGACPTSHPVKAKLSSGIYHLPGGANYDRTQADRCYTSATAAESDGLRPAKR